jgi:hypothetical protein
VNALVTLSRLRAVRLASQLLASADEPDVPAVVERMLAMQGQDFPAVCWAIGARASRARLADVYDAFDAGILVRSWPLRGTLHVIPSADLRWMLSITATRQVRAARRRHADLGLDATVIERARDVAVEALSGGRALDRAAFLTRLQEAGIDTDGQRGYHIIWYLGMTGILVWGPMHGPNQLLVLADEWLPASDPVERDEALGRFLVRYLAGHGPASLDDFAWWAGITKADATTALNEKRAELVELSFNGDTLWAPADGHDNGRQPSKAMAMLPAFDEYLLGYRDRSRVLAPEHGDAVVPGGNGIFQPLLLSHGKVVGTWRRAVERDALKIRPLPFGPLPHTASASLRSAAARYGRFLGIGSVEVRAQDGDGL